MKIMCFHFLFGCMLCWPIYVFINFEADCVSALHFFLKEQSSFEFRDVTEDKIVQCTV